MLNAASRRGAGTLVEVLLALLLLGFLLPALLDSVETGILLDLHAQKTQDRLYGAAWWFNRVETPASSSGLAAMPRVTPDGALRFRWTVAETPGGSLLVSLDVTVGAEDAPLTFFRVF